MPEGTLITAHPELVDATNAAHGAAIDRLKRLLAQSGVLVPHYQATGRG